MKENDRTNSMVFFKMVVMKQNKGKYFFFRRVIMHISRIEILTPEHFVFELKSGMRMEGIGGVNGG
jgi:hypothetical protein